MKPTLGANQEIQVGEPAVIESDSPDGNRGVVFEDDGETGYFYARDFTVPDSTFEDALHIYSVEGVSDADQPSTVVILWSGDGLKACLLINRYPHAVFDFESKCGYSRDVFPEPAAGSEWTHQDWEDGLRDWFFSAK